MDVLDASRARDLEPDPALGKTKKWDRAHWLRIYEEKGTVTAACKSVGISRQTAYTERKDNPEFAAAWDRAEAAVTDVLEKTAVERALEGSDRLMEFMLKARRPGTYRETVSVKHGGKINIEVEEGVDEAVNDALSEVDRLTSRLAQVAPDGQTEVPRGDEGADMAPAVQSGAAGTP